MLFLCLFLANTLLAQNTIGLPTIINYSKQQYNAGRQNWGMVQDKKGIMYFANNDGLLTFDGVFWQLYPLPNKTVVRSLAIDAAGRIFVGAQGEIGFFAPDKKGQLIYQSLNKLIPEKENVFTDVWNTCVSGKQVFFRSNKRILQYTGDTVLIHNSVNWAFMGVAAGQLLAMDYDRGLVALKGGVWRPVARHGAFPAGAMVRTALPLGRDSVLLPTLTHGIYLLYNDTISKFSTPDIEAIAKKNIYNVVELAGDRLAVITNLGGCFIINKKGHYIQQFSKQEGIQNNNILSILQDKDENLWLGLDNGIDLVIYNNAIKNIFPEQQDRNSGYAAYVFKNHLYIGLSTGLYKARLGNGHDLSYTSGNFELVKNTKGQVWNLSEVNGRLFMAHTSGAYEITGEGAMPVDNKTGFWNFQSLGSASGIVAAGNYNGINFYKDSAGHLINPRVNAHFESARFVLLHQGLLWVAHPYKGLYKVRFDVGKKPEVEQYQNSKGVLSANHNKLYKISDRLILTSDNGIFEYSDKAGDFVKAADLEKIFEYKGVSYLKEDQFGNIWFCRDKKVGVVDRSGAAPRLVYIPELDDKIMASGFEYINVADSSNVFIAAEKGFFHVNYTDYKKNKYPISVVVRQVSTVRQQEGNLLYGGFADIADKPSVEYKNNGLYFQCSALLYGQIDNTEYAYYLEGFDQSWSAWTRKPEKEYANLPAGTYTFQVKARNNYDNESPVATYTFTILPPWYQTWWAYSLYGIAVFSVLFLLYKIQQRRYRKQQAARLIAQQKKYAEEQEHLKLQHQLTVQENEKQIIQLRNEKLQAEIEQKKLEEERERLYFRHQLEVEKNEKEIVRLRNEKLQSELAHKNKELASSAMNLVRKREMLSKLKEDLQEYRKQADGEKSHKDFLKILRVLDKELDHKEEWEQFAMHFDHVHSNYLQRLQEFCPDLTSSELKLAAYLRLNLSTKEIAQLMNISVRGVETSRYRLRKKLALANDVSLSGFLSSVTR